jgi:hypothetical protein
LVADGAISVSAEGAEVRAGADVGAGIWVAGSKAGTV